MPVGRCQNCRREFVSRYNGKKFCSMPCYTSSPEFLTRIRKQSSDLAAKAREAQGLKPDVVLPKNCLHCSKEYYVKPGQFKRSKYCSRSCYRGYMAERFDRFVANPETIALPQCYDEFLTQEELPCLFYGCTWRGTHLSNHVNFTHGVTADKFKEMAGFNKSTGVVTAALSKHFSDRFKEIGSRMYLEGKMPPPPPHPRGTSVRLEGKEHGFKANKLIAAATKNINYSCRSCGQKFSERVNGLTVRKFYCSTRCRSQFYGRKRFRVKCSHCGLEFTGTPAQHRSVATNRPVCCSVACRNARNIVFALSKRGIRSVNHSL